MNDDYEYTVEVQFVTDELDTIKVRCRDSVSPLTAIEKAIKAFRTKQRITCNYRQAIGFRILSIKPVEA